MKAFNIGDASIHLKLSDIYIKPSKAKEKRIKKNDHVLIIGRNKAKQRV